MSAEGSQEAVREALGRSPEGGQRAVYRGAKVFRTLSVATVNSQFELTVGSSPGKKPTVRKALTVATH